LVTEPENGAVAVRGEVNRIGIYWSACTHYEDPSITIADCVRDSGLVRLDIARNNITCLNSWSSQCGAAACQELRCEIIRAGCGSVVVEDRYVICCIDLEVF